MVKSILKITIMWLLIVVGLVTAQFLMDVPVSNGDFGVFVRHTLGIWLAFFTGAFWGAHLR